MRMLPPNEVVVAVDGSAFAERALPCGRWAADRFGVPLHVLQIASPGQRDAAERHLRAAATTWGAGDVRVACAPDAVNAITATIGYGDGVLGCMATHGRGRSAALLGSVARRVVENVQAPVMLVGPSAVAPGGDGAVVVAVEGSADDVDVARVGVDWAAALGTRMVLLTVFEPAPDPVVDRPGHLRSHGPDAPGAYLAGLVAELSSPPVALRTDFVADPVSVRGDIAAWLAGHEAALLVVGARRDHGLRRLLDGDHCSQVVHDATVPTIVVPIGLRR